MIKQFLIPLFLLLHATQSVGCQNAASYLQLLPGDICRQTMNCALSNQPLWKDYDQSNRIEQAITVSRILKELGMCDLQAMIINRMRKDLANAKMEIATSSTDFFCPENPKTLTQLLPIKNIFSYYALDKEWIQKFVLSKTCGGTLRKHIFMAAMKYKHDELVIYLWQTRYRRTTVQKRNRLFLGKARIVAQAAGYAEIHKTMDEEYSKITAQIKASKMYYTEKGIFPAYP